MELDLDAMDANLQQITPSEKDRLQQKAKDAKSAEGIFIVTSLSTIIWSEKSAPFTDDIAIAEAINEIEEELKEKRPSLFNPSDMMNLDLNEIDANLKQISPTEDQFIIQSVRDAASAEGKIIFVLVS
jgi:hypothetical protein